VVGKKEEESQRDRQNKSLNGTAKCPRGHVPGSLRCVRGSFISRRPHAVAVPPLSSHSAFRFALITLTLFASFERDLIHDRVTAGLERAGKAGKTFGRPAPTTKAGPLSSTRSAFVPWPPQPRASVRSPPSSACTAPPCAA